MEFLKAEKLKKIFGVKGSFYNLEKNGHLFECRNYALVYRRGSAGQEKYDALMVLVNPGLCSPSSSTYEIPHLNIRELTSERYTIANTDNTQYQIMRFMELKKWKKVMIINLSDIRAGNLDSFKKELKKAEEVGFQSHSIFSSQRKEELAKVLANNRGPIILAWGTDTRFKKLAKLAITALPSDKIVGVEYTTRPFFYHASPPPLDGKIKWLTEMNEKV